MKSERVEFGVNSSLMRIEEKCTHCGLCKKTCDSIHGIYPECIKCGQCILTCPMGAIVPKYDYQTVLNYLNDTDYTCIISIAPAARVSLIKELNITSGDPTKYLIGVLRLLGFDYVYDVAVGADLTTIEESMEFIERIKENKFPLITSCCPSWKMYAIHHGLDKYISTTKSPIRMQGYLVKDYVSKYIDFKKKIINVLLMPCVSKKEEILEDDNIDYVITTRELLYMINESKIDLCNVNVSDFDSLAGNASSSGIIFGTSGGVMESIIRTTYYLMNNKELPNGLYNKMTNNDKFIDEYTYDLDKIKIKTLKLCGMNYIKNVDLSKYHLIEVMACPGGCINGGGQPLVNQQDMDECRNFKSKMLLNIDDNNTFNASYKSEEIKDVYKYDIGIPGGKISHKKLHINNENANK